MTGSNGAPEAAPEEGAAPVNPKKEASQHNLFAGPLENENSPPKKSKAGFASDVETGEVSTHHLTGLPILPLPTMNVCIMICGTHGGKF